MRVHRTVWGGCAHGGPFRLPAEVRAEATCRPLCRALCSDMRSGALDIRGAPLLLAVESVAARVSRARATVWVPGRFSLLSTPAAADRLEGRARAAQRTVAAHAAPHRPTGYGSDQDKRASQRPDMQGGGEAPARATAAHPPARGTLGRLRRALGAGSTPAPAGRPPLRQRSRARTSIDDADTAGEEP